MKTLRLGIALVLLAATSAALATTYVRVEKDGTKTYSDRPFPGGVPVVVEPAQTYSAPPATNTASGLTTEQRLLQEIDDFKYASCSILPSNDETFTNPEQVNVSVNLNPPLRPSDSLSFTVDGIPVSTYTQSYVLQRPDRGTHSVQVTITDKFGRTVCNANASFHVMRPSVNMPQRR